MKHEKTLSELTVSLKWVVGCILTLILILILFFLFEPAINQYIQSVKTNLGANAQFGDWFGGFIGTIISFFTLIFVGLTYRSQRKQLTETRDQVNKQQFEAVFFNMLQMINTIGKEIEVEYFPSAGTSRIVKGLDFYKYFMDKMRESKFRESIPDAVLFFINDKLAIKFPTRFKRHLPPEEYQHAYLLEQGLTIEDLKGGLKKWYDEENESEYYGFVYEYYFLMFNSNLGHFFRYLYNTIKYVIKERKSYNDCEDYINLIQSQLSNFQLTVLFYSCLSKVSYDSKGKPSVKALLDELNFFQNIPQSLLISPHHQLFYPKTDFKDRYFSAPARSDDNDIDWERSFNV